jgi:hypothetical protein
MGSTITASTMIRTNISLMKGTTSHTDSRSLAVVEREVSAKFSNVLITKIKNLLLSRS